MAYYAPFYRPAYYGTQNNQEMMNQYGQQFQPMNPQAQQVPQPAQQTSQSSPMIWVSGEAGAKSYLVAPNTTVMLMDAENPTFYLKSADASGMPLPLRVFDYKERTEAAQQPVTAPVEARTMNLDNFVTREELEQRLALIASQCQCATKGRKKKEEVEDAEPVV